MPLESLSDKKGLVVLIKLVVTMVKMPFFKWNLYIPWLPWVWPKKVLSYWTTTLRETYIYVFVNKVTSKICYLDDWSKVCWQMQLWCNTHIHNLSKFVAFFIIFCWHTIRDPSQQFLLICIMQLIHHFLLFHLCRATTFLIIKNTYMSYNVNCIKFLRFLTNILCNITVLIASKYNMLNSELYSNCNCNYNYK